MKNKLKFFVCIALLGVVLQGCYPDTLRQQLAGTDTVEIIFYPTQTQPQDTIITNNKRHINKILNYASKEKYHNPPIAIKSQHLFAKIIFKKQMQQRLLMEAALYFDGRQAYLAYHYKGQTLYRKSDRMKIELLTFLRTNKAFYGMEK